MTLSPDDPAIDEAWSIIDNALALEVTRAQEAAFSLGVSQAEAELKLRDLRDPEAEAVLRRNELRLVRGVTVEQREAIRAAIRDGIRSGVRQTPGRVIPGDVAAQIGRVLDAAEWRLNAIARTEMNRAANGARYEAWRTSGVVTHSRVVATIDGRTRASHLAAHGDTAPLGQPFTRGAAAGQSRPPWDVNCVLPGTMVRGLFTGGIRSKYSGPAVEIVTRMGHRLRVTANHPVLTSNGFTPAGSIEEGFHLVADRFSVNSASGCNVEDAPAPIEQVFDMLSGPRAELPASRARLYGDEVFIEGNVDVANAEGSLLSHDVTTGSEGTSNLVLPESSMTLLLHPSDGSLPLDTVGVGASASSVPSSGELTFNGASSTFLDSGPFETLSLASPTGVDPGAFEVSNELGSADSCSVTDALHAFSVEVRTDQGVEVRHGNRLVGGRAQISAVLPEATVESVWADPGFAGKVLDALPSLVTLDEVVEVRHFDFTGHVYDLESPVGWFRAGGITLKNCRCTTVPITVASDPSEVSETEAENNRGIREELEQRIRDESNPARRRELEALLEGAMFRPAAVRGVIHGLRGVEDEHARAMMRIYRSWPRVLESRGRSNPRNVPGVVISG